MNMLTKIKEMDTKKKIKLGIVVVVIIIIIFEIPGFFSSGSSGSSITPQTAQPIVVKKIVPSVRPKEIVVDHVSPAISALEKNQKDYVKALNTLQMLQVQDKIATLQQSISQANLAKQQTEQQLNTLSSPAPQQSVPLTSYAKALINPGSPVTNNTAPSSDNYKLLYLSNDSGNWQAVIGNNGRMYNVNLNTALPDGSVVTKITSDHVILNNNGQERMLSLTPLM